jgi:cysteine desulfurase
VAGFAEALGAFVRNPVFPKGPLFDLTSRLERVIDSIPGAAVQGSRFDRLANTVSFTVEGADSVALLAALDLEGICASSGSACSSGALEPSHVLQAMGVASSLANSFIRFSLGRESTLSEVRVVEGLLPDLIGRCRHYQ